MRKTFFQALLIFALLALPAAVLILRWQRPAAPVVDQAPASPELRHDEPAGSASEPPEPVDLPVEPAAIPEDAVFARWEAELQPDGGRLGARERFLAWREGVLGLPREQAPELLRGYWASGRDAATGLPFAPGEDGELATAPTLRTAVLDLLGRLEPAAAHALAAEALEAPKRSADEYALHLRNYAWGAPPSLDDVTVRDYLAEKALELVRHGPWQEDPSGGYQEAFDVLVWAEAARAVPTLAALMARDQPRELRQPASLTLDRLVLLEPEAALGALRENPELLASQPLAEASYFARADPANPGQRALLEAYFLAPERTAEQRDYLLELLPNLNLRLSHNLLTAPWTFSRERVIERLESTRALLRDWTTQQPFEPWESEIEAQIRRLDDTLAPIEPGG